MTAGAGVMAMLYLSVFVLAESWARLGAPPPEWPRKLVHAGCGLLSLMLPRCVHSPRSVLVLAVLFSAFCFWGRRARVLRSLGVRRPSVGSESYPFGIFLVFVMAADRYWLYAAAILTLALADAGAALIGAAYGKSRYAIADESRTLEGSLAFALLAFLSIFASMSGLGGFGCARAALTAAAGAVVATGIEAVSLRGWDNVLVPVGVCAVLPRLAALWA